VLVTWGSLLIVFDVSDSHRVSSKSLGCHQCHETCSDIDDYKNLDFVTAFITTLSTSAPPPRSPPSHNHPSSIFHLRQNPWTKELGYTQPLEAQGLQRPACIKSSPHPLPPSIYSLPPVKRYPSVAVKYSHLGKNTSYLICWRQQIKCRRTLG
jgi:hypothetical protein